MAAGQKLFEERSDQSEVKTRIVSSYFSAWAQVVMPTTALNGGKIAYIDLYAGPERLSIGHSHQLGEGAFHLTDTCGPLTTSLSG